jgi:hypothetical protein
MKRNVLGANGLRLRAGGLPLPLARLFAQTYADFVGCGSHGIGRNEVPDESPRSFNEHKLICQATFQ